VLVGHQACLGHGGGHTPGIAEPATQSVRAATHTHCTALEGPALVRISSSPVGQRA